MAFPDYPFREFPFDTPSPQGPKKSEKSVPWEAKVIDGVYYVPLSQFAEVLALNDVLPAVRRGIEDRVEAQRLRREAGL